MSSLDAYKQKISEKFKGILRTYNIIFDIK